MLSGLSLAWSNASGIVVAIAAVVAGGKRGVQKVSIVGKGTNSTSDHTVKHKVRIVMTKFIAFMNIA